MTIRVLLITILIGGCSSAQIQKTGAVLRAFSEGVKTPYTYQHQQETERARAEGKAQAKAERRERERREKLLNRKIPETLDPQDNRLT